MADVFLNQLTDDTPPAVVQMDVRVRQTTHDLDQLNKTLTFESDHYRIRTAAPSVLQHFFIGEVDLAAELNRRFNNAPLMSQFDLRSVTAPGVLLGTAMLSTQDNSATLTFDVDGRDSVLTCTFTLGAMLSLRFTLRELDRQERRRWQDLMQQEQGVAFLWSRLRWEQDYLIFVVGRYNVHFYAISPHGYEAAARLTPDVRDAVLGWLGEYWT
ncbi:MAG: hypothetical protein JW910_11855 [Anaerolineae bacterium]|nr:hypothetical protein [Anaerolineae bacterium]